MPQPGLKLYEQPGKRGEAEKIRILLKETGITYSGVEPSKEEYDDMCTYKDGSLLFGTLPALSTDGKDGEFLEVSTCIMEHVASLADAAGDGSVLYCGEPENRSQVRAIAAKATEAFRAVFAAGDGERKDVITKYFQVFQNVISKNDDDDASTEEFTVGKQFTYADISVFEFVNACTESFANVGLRSFPKLKEFHDVVAAKARIGMHLSMRPALNKDAEAAKFF